MKIKDDPTIARVRKARHDISARFGHDTKKLIVHYLERQKKYAESRFVKMPLSKRIKKAQ